MLEGQRTPGEAPGGVPAVTVQTCCAAHLCSSPSGMSRRHCSGGKELRVRPGPHRAARGAVIGSALGGTWRACGTDTTPPCAARAAHGACAAASREASTAAPKGGTDQVPHRLQGPPAGCTREETSPQAPQCLMRRYPPGHPLCASVRWPRHRCGSSEALAITICSITPERAYRRDKRGVMSCARPHRVCIVGATGVQVSPIETLHAVSFRYRCVHDCFAGQRFVPSKGGGDYCLILIPILSI